MIFVVGVARSGTSSVARVLEQRFGVDMGGPGVVRPSNPQGIYERDWVADADQKYGSGLITVREWSRVVHAGLANLTEPFGIKHPFNITHVETWIALRPEATIIWVTRNLEDVVASWLRVYSWPEREARRNVAAAHRKLGHVVGKLDPIRIDMTERRTDDEIVDALTMQGVEPV